MDFHGLGTLKSHLDISLNVIYSSSETLNHLVEGLFWVPRVQGILTFGEQSEVRTYNRFFALKIINKSTSISKLSKSLSYANDKD